jgi:HK97 family phage major capsid protein/HK97 family phage prohead protease
LEDMNRAYSILSVKSIDDDLRVIRGVATTPSVDREGDIIEPMGVKVASDIPLFLYHDSKQVVGRAKFGKATKDGIPFEATLPHVKEAGRLKDRVDEAWQMVKYRLITGVSIGFQAAMDSIERMKDGGIRFLESEVLELSLVPIPANAEATIHSIKSIDKGAASGPPLRTVPGVTGAKQPASGGFFYSQTQGKNVNLNEIVDGLQSTIQVKQARMAEIAAAAQEAGSFGVAERGEFDVLEGEVEKLQDDLRFKRMEARHAATAKPVVVKGGMTFVKTQDPEDKFQGQSYVRSIIARALAGSWGNPAEIAANRWGKSNPNFVRYMKAAVAGGGTDSGEWGAELVAMDGRFSGDFIEFLRSSTVYDRLPLRTVPANVTIKGQDGQGAGYWVGQSKAIPVSAQDFSTVNLTPLKVAALSVVSNQLLRDSSPEAEALVAASLQDASSQRVDQTFLSTTAASSGVSPAGLLNGVTAGVPSGADAAAVRADILTLYTSFLTAKNASGIYLVMTPSLAKAISLMVTSLGATEFPGLNAGGGTLLGDPVVTGDNVTGGHLIALKPSDIYRIGDTGVEVSVSREATIEMNDAAAGASDTPVAMASHAVSMYQTESTAIKVVRSINYAKRRTGVVQYIDNVEYGGVVS